MSPTPASAAGGRRPIGRRWQAPLLYLLLLIGLGAGIWGTYRAVFPGRGLYRVTGIFEARVGDTMILVRHDAVPGLMEEMKSMMFFAESREVIDRAKLAQGDRIRFTLRQTPDKLLVVDIQRLP
jgi:hypothetical protein